MHLKHSPHLRHPFYTAAAVLLFGAALSGDTKPAATLTPTTPTEHLIKDNFIKAFNDGQIKNLTEFLETYQGFMHDTIVINKQNARKRMCLGQYIPQKDSVELKHFVLDYAFAGKSDSASINRFAEFNLPENINRVAIHELCHLTFHRQNKIKKISIDYYLNPNLTPPAFPLKLTVGESMVIKAGVLSLEDAAAIGQYNEIGAEIGRRLYERELYLKSGDIKAFTKEDIYVAMIKEGSINPSDDSKTARNREYCLLTMAVRDTWLTKEKDNYAYTSLNDINAYLKRSQKEQFMIPEKSLGNSFEQHVSGCLTFPIDGELLDLSKYVIDGEMSPQPMVQARINQYKAKNKLFVAPNIPFSPFSRIINQTKGR